MLQNAIQNPGQQVDCQLVVQAVEPTKFNDNRKAYQQTVLRDPSENNADYNVKIWQGQGTPLDASHINQTLPFRIKGRAYGNKVYLSGFWQQPRGQQAPPAGAGQAKAPAGGVEPPKGNKDKLIVTQVVYKVLGGHFQDPNEFDVWLMGNLPVLKRHTNLLMKITEPDQGGQPPDDIPF